MLVKIHQTLLAQALGKVIRAAPGKATMPVLSNVLLTTEGDGLRLAATNLEITISTWCGCTVEAPGAITVPARLLAEVVGTLPAAEVTLETDETQTLRVKCGTSKTAIKGIDAQEFPPLPQPVGEAVEIAASELRDLIHRVGFAVSVEEHKPSLMGVNFSGSQAQATDGFRLAVCPALLPSMLVARLGEVERLTAGVETVQVYKLAGSALWRCGNTDVTTPLIDGKFPDVNQVIPKSHKVAVTAETLALAAEVKRARMFADFVKLGIGGGVMTVEANGDNGHYAGEVTIDEGSAVVTVSFNARFLLDALTAAGKTVDIAIIDGKSPVVFTSPEVEGWQAVIMPVSKG